MSSLKTLSGAVLTLFAATTVAAVRWYIREDPFLRDVDRWLAERDL